MYRVPSAVACVLPQLSQFRLFTYPVPSAARSIWPGRVAMSFPVPVWVQLTAGWVQTVTVVSEPAATVPVGAVLAGVVVVGVLTGVGDEVRLGDAAPEAAGLDDGAPVAPAEPDRYAGGFGAGWRARGGGDPAPAPNPAGG